MALLEAKQLNRVCSEKLTIKDVSFEISEKGIYGFLGEADSGMEELAKLLAGITIPDSGSLFYKEKEMFRSEKQTALIKKKIGYVPDKSFFDGDMTVFEVLDLIGKAKRIDSEKRFLQIKEGLELTGLSKKKNVLIKELTTAEKKRLSITSALLGNPDVMIMYEPLRALDKTQTQNIKSLITFLGTKKVVILFSSRPSEIEELCGFSAIFAQGRIAIFNSVEAILTTLNDNGFGGLADALEAYSAESEKEEA